MATERSSSQSERENKNILLRMAHDALVRLVTEQFRLALNKGVYAQDGVLGAKLSRAKEQFAEAKGLVNQEEKRESLQNIALQLLKIDKESKDFTAARESSGNSIQNEVDSVLDKAVKDEGFDLSEEKKKALIEKSQALTRRRNNEFLHQSQNLADFVKSNGSKDPDEIVQESDHRIEVARKVRADKLSGENSADELNDSSFSSEVEKSLEEVKQYAEDNGIVLEAFHLNNAQKELVGQLGKMKSILEGMDNDYPLTAEYYGKIRNLIKDELHNLPQGEREVWTNWINEHDVKYAWVSAESRSARSTRSPRESSSRYTLTPEEAASKYSDIRTRLKDKRINFQQAKAEIEAMDVGDEEAFKRAMFLQQFRRGGIEGMPIGLLDADLTGDLNEGMMMDMRDPDRVFEDVLRQVSKLTNLERTDFDKDTFKFAIDHFVMKIIQTRSGRRGDYNVMQLNAYLDQLIRSRDALKTFKITEKERSDARDQIAMVMAFYDFGQAGSTINMEQWSGMWRGLPTEGFADMLTYETDLTVRYQSPSGQDSSDKVTLNIGAMRDILHHEHLASLVLSRSFDERRLGHEMLALYTMASQLNGWVDVKTDAGTTDFSKFHFSKDEANGRIEVWMDTGSVKPQKFVFTGVSGPLMNGRGDVADLLNQGYSLSEYVVNLEKHVTLGLAKYNHKYDGDFNDQLYKYIDPTYARTFGIPLWHEIFEALDPMKRDPVTETYFKQSKQVISKMAAANNVDSKSLSDMMQFLTTNSDGYHMTNEQMIANFNALMKDLIATNTYGERVSRLDRLSINERANIEQSIEQIFKDPTFDWKIIIYHHLGLKEEAGHNELLAAVRKRLRLSDGQPLPKAFKNGNIELKGLEGFKTFLFVEQSSKVYSLSSAGPGDAVGATNLGKSAYSQDMAKQADYLFRSTKAFGSIVSLSSDFDVYKFLEFMESNGDEAYSYMNREQRESLIAKVFKAKDKVYRRQFRVLAYERDANNTVQFAGVSEDGTSFFKSKEKNLYHLGHDRGYNVEPPWFSKWYIDELNRRGLITNHKMLEHLYGEHVETLAGISLNKLSFNPYAWMGKLPLVGKYLKGFIPHHARWGLGPMINYIRKELSLLDVPEYVGNVLGEWANIVGAEAKSAAENA